MGTSIRKCPCYEHNADTGSAKCEHQCDDQCENTVRCVTMESLQASSNLSEQTCKQTTQMRSVSVYCSKICGAALCSDKLCGPENMGGQSSKQAEGITRINLGFIGVDMVVLRSAEHIKTAIDSGDLERLQVRAPRRRSANRTVTDQACGGLQ